MTLAAGAEEVSAYLPLFATDSAPRLAATAATLPLMAALWLAAAALLVRSPPVAALVERYGEAAEPFLLIAVGVYCLLGSVVLPCCGG